MLVKRKYYPENSCAKIDVEITEEQAKALDKIWDKEQFSAYFWAEKIVWLNNGNITEDGQRVARIGGNHYVIGNEDADPFWKGMGGSRCYIQFHNGDYVESTNLWHQGSIPEELKNILVNNADWSDKNGNSRF